MPIREYQCEACGRRFEKIQKTSDPPLDVCPHCGGGPVHKVLSSPAIQFKGSGWYVTDYARKDSGGGKAAAESGDSSASKTKDAAKSTESSPSKKTESSTDKSGS
jgi:putative FmdB family regulatory protein